jgi:hypothetical protein
MGSASFKAAMRALMCAVALAGIAPAFAADTHIYKDVLKPNGHARGMAEKFADFRACGYRKGTSVNDSVLLRIDACMRGRGWALDHVVPDPQARRAQHARARTQADPPKEYRRFDDEMGGWVTCHEILGGIGEACSNF